MGRSVGVDDRRPVLKAKALHRFLGFHPIAGSWIEVLELADPMGGGASGVYPSRGPRDRSASHREKETKVVALAGEAVADVVASRVSVRDLKTHLSEWLARAQAGEVVEVTSHRKPIAHITAISQPNPASMGPLQEAIQAGTISWNGKKPVLPAPVQLRGSGTLTSDMVIEDRG